jgi:hypothetical protein
MLAMGGKLTSIADFSRDRFGGRRFLKWECNDLRLGNFVNKPNDGIVFEDLDDGDVKGKVLWLSCRTPDRRVTF